jgi:cell shape-determining protein MreD
MKRLILPILVLIAFVLETKLQVMGFSLNLTILFVYFVGLRYGHIKGLAMGVLLGAMSDAVTGSFLGPALLGKATVGYLAFYLRRGLFIWTPILGIVGLASLTMIDGLITYLSTAIFFAPHNTFGGVALAIIFQALTNAALGLFITPGEEDIDEES